MASSGGVSLPLDLAPPKPWRRFVPRWLRSLMWVDSAQKYDAFLSYSWKSDSNVAPVIQLLIQDFLRPWHRLKRAKTVFRDLSCLPAGSNLEAELRDRLDRSMHLIVLASPEAASSDGMEMEGRYWFSRPRDGQVVIIISSGDCKTWAEIREHLVPPAVRDNLQAAPVWASVQNHRARIVANPTDHQLRGELIEQLKQVILRFYPGRDWGQLQGEERRQRRRFIRVLWAVISTLLLLCVALAVLAWYANHERLEAARESKRAEEEAKAELAASQQELAARKRAEASSQSEFQQRLAAQGASFERDMNVALASQYRSMLPSSPAGDAAIAGTLPINNRTVQQENSRTLPESFRISFPLAAAERGNIFWHFEHRFFDSRPISGLQEQLRFVSALGLLTTDDERQIADAERTDPLSTVYLIVRYDGNIGESPFLRAGSTIAEPEYQAIVRRAMWTAIATDPQFAYRARLLNDDRLWKEASQIGNPELLKNLFRRLDGNLNEVQSLVVVADYLKAAWWSSAMSDCSRSLANLWQLVTKNTEIGPADARIARAQQNAVRALSRLASLNNPNRNFNEPWGILAMDLASNRASEVELTITGVGPPIHRRRATSPR